MRGRYCSYFFSEITFYIYSSVTAVTAVRAPLLSGLAAHSSQLMLRVTAPPERDTCAADSIAYVWLSRHARSVLSHDSSTCVTTALIARCDSTTAAAALWKPLRLPHCTIRSPPAEHRLPAGRGANHPDARGPPSETKATTRHERGHRTRNPRQNGHRGMNQRTAADRGEKGAAAGRSGHEQSPVEPPKKHTRAGRAIHEPVNDPHSTKAVGNLTPLKSHALLRPSTALLLSLETTQ